MAARTWQLSLLLWALVVIARSPYGAIAQELLPASYFVNQTFMERQFPCSRQDMECFKKQQLLYEPDGQCYSVGEQGPCAEGEFFHADYKEASRLGGHFRGTCSNVCADVTKYQVAATGECLTKKEIETKICREALFLRPALNVFAQWVCEWTQLPCETLPRESLQENPYRGQYDYREYNGLCRPPVLLKDWINDNQNITVMDEKTSNHPIFQLFTNKTYRDREYPCTEEEKACLQYGRLLHSDGNCYTPGKWSTACFDGHEYHIDWEEAMKEDGRLQGTCKSPCSSSISQPHIATGECTRRIKMDDVCRPEWNLRAMLNEFGQWSCKCGWSPSAPRTGPPALPPPASGPGLCRAPDFFKPVRAPSYDVTLTLGFRVACSEAEHACLREGRVLAGGACHALRTQGPCAQGEELVLDKDALAHARLQAVCRARPCPQGSVLVPIDAKCLTHQQVISRLCKGQKVSLDEFGGWQCDFEGAFPANLSRVTRDASDGSCELPGTNPTNSDDPIDPMYSSNNTDFMTNSTDSDENDSNNTV